MKKSPIIFFTILMAFLGNFAILKQNTHALYQENDVNWWTVDELLAFSEQVDQETQEKCGEDIGCRQELFFTNMESSDDRYRALDRLYQTQFNIASINPSQETIEILFFDQDAMLRQMNIPEHHPLTYIFLAWSEHIETSIGSYDYSHPDAEQLSDGMHVIYSNGTHLGADFPSNQKFNLSIQDTNLANDSIGRIYAATFGEQYNSKGFIDYSACINAEDYAPGTKCQLMISADYGSQYLPPRNNLNNNLSLTSIEGKPGNGLENRTLTPESTTQNAPEEVLTPSNNSRTSSLEAVAKTDDPIINHNVESTNGPKTPETGTNTAPCEKVVEFPWWLIPLLAAGDAVVLWLFWPKKR